MTEGEKRLARQDRDNRERDKQNQATIESAKRQRKLMEEQAEAEAIVSESLKENEKKIVHGRYQKENAQSHVQVDSWAKPGKTQLPN